MGNRHGRFTNIALTAQNSNIFKIIEFIFQSIFKFQNDTEKREFTISGAPVYYNMREERTDIVYGTKTSDPLKFLKGLAAKFSEHLYSYIEAREGFQHSRFKCQAKKGDCVLWPWIKSVMRVRMMHLMPRGNQR